jgi:hypothetical protein
MVLELVVLVRVVPVPARVVPVRVVPAQVDLRVVCARVDPSRAALRRMDQMLVRAAAVVQRPVGLADRRRVVWGSGARSLGLAPGVLVTRRVPAGVQALAVRVGTSLAVVSRR